MSRNKSNAEPWRSSSERHYCAICNVWMDRFSKAGHENGKKHKELLEQSIQEKRTAKATQVSRQKELHSTLAAMNKAAVVSHLEQDVGQFGGTLTGSDSWMNNVLTQSLPATASAETGIQQPSIKINKLEKKEWVMRKKKRLEEKMSKEEDEKDPEQERDLPTLPHQASNKPSLGEHEGHYTLQYDDNPTATIYLEGLTYATLLEEDMAIELWMGNVLANSAEKRLLDKQHLWIKALIARVRTVHTTDILVDVAYLKQPNDEEETIETSVSPSRLRLVLGSDERLPETLEEARLAVMGEQIIVMNQDAASIDEATGFSSWGTVEIRKTTARNIEKEQRDLQRKKQRDEQQRLEREQKETESRRMEEQKVDNAEDSALGAYDVWSSGTTGYKGVDINSTENKLTVADTAKSLSKGMGAVLFKKKVLKGNKKQCRRYTSADE